MSAPSFYPEITLLTRSDVDVLEVEVFLIAKMVVIICQAHQMPPHLTKHASQSITFVVVSYIMQIELCFD